ncbi:globin [Micromonospora sp. HNM0581]|uniref:globin n=1 Tax=Micromonospora sp. HNM0581 TaxID=2716341 RepID=UPI001F0E94C8|nr:globin [Micromonospora sp. HNM0581]
MLWTVFVVMRTTEFMVCPRDVADWLGPTGVRTVVHRWMRLVAADAELAPYLLGIDRPRLAGQLAAQLSSAMRGLGGRRRSAVGLWRRLGLTEEQHVRVLDYLAAVLWVLDLPVDTIFEVQRAAGAPRP